VVNKDVQNHAILFILAVPRVVRYTRALQA